MLDTSLGHGRCPLDASASKSNSAFRGYARQMQAFALASRPAASLRNPARVFPLHSAQALPPCTRPKALRPWTLRPRKAILLSEATLGKCKHLLSLVGLRPPSEPRARAFPLHPAQVLSPCTRPTGAALWIPGKGLSLAFRAGAPPCTRPHKKRYRFDTAFCVDSPS